MAEAKTKCCLPVCSGVASFKIQKLICGQMCCNLLNRIAVLISFVVLFIVEAEAEQGKLKVVGTVATIDSARPFELSRKLAWPHGKCSRLLGTLRRDREPYLLCIRSDGEVKVIEVKSGILLRTISVETSSNSQMIASDLDLDGEEELLVVEFRDKPRILMIKPELGEIIELSPAEEVSKEIIHVIPTTTDASGRFLHLLFVGGKGGEAPRAFYYSFLNGKLFLVNSGEFGRIPSSSRITPVVFSSAETGIFVNNRNALTIYGPKQSKSGLQEQLSVFLPEGQTQRASYIGDFSGDGSPELVSYSGPLSGWWRISTSAAAPIPMSITGLPRFVSDSELQLALVKDLNADGATDLAFLSENELSIYTRMIRPIKNAKVRVNDRDVGVEEASFDTWVDSLSEVSVSAEIVSSTGSTFLAKRKVAAHLLKNSKVHADLIFSEQHVSSKKLIVAPQDGPDFVGPKRCFGISPSLHLDNDTEQVHCPSGHYILSVDDSMQANAEPGEFVARSICCPLPDATMTTDERVAVIGVCPSDHIVTGHSVRVGQPSFPLRVVCSKLDRSKWKTGNFLPGFYFGPRSNPDKASEGRVPPALMSAGSRNTYSNWDVDFCAGQPFGAPLVGIRGPKCRDLLFAEIWSHKDEAVEMFPQCPFPGSRFSPIGGC